MAKKMINFLCDDGGTVAVETDVPDPPSNGDAPGIPRLRKVPAVVSEHGLYIIKQAITLKAAILGRIDCASGGAMEEQGNLLVMICSDWIKAESARLSGKGGA